MKKNKWDRQIAGTIILSVSFLVSFLLAYEGQNVTKPIQSTRTLNWETDVQPILCSTIKIYMWQLKDRVLKDAFGGDERVTLDIVDSLPESELAADSLALAVSRVLIEKRALVLPLTNHYFVNFVGPTKVSYLYDDEGEVRSLVLNFSAQKNGVIPQEEFPSLKERYCREFFSDPLVLRILMPGLHAALNAMQVSCPDCPGPTALSTRQIKLADLMPYCVSYFHPKAISKEQEVTFAVRIGMDAGSRITPVDTNLVVAANLCLNFNTSAERAIGSLLREAFQQKEYKKSRKTMTDEETLAYLRSFLEIHLPTDQQFINSIRERARVIFPKLGIKCEEL